MNRRFVPALIGLLAVCSPALSKDAAPDKTETLTLRYSGDEDPSIAQLPFIIAQKKGFFARQRLDVKLVKSGLGPGDASVEGYVPQLEGEADMTRITSGFLIRAVLGGSDAVGVLAVANNPIYSVMAGPNVKSFADLKGKTIALNSPWDTIAITARHLLASHGLGPSDVKYRQVRSSDGRLQCIKSGECAAAVVGQPADIKAIKAGFHRLGMNIEGGPVIFNVEAVRREWAKTHKETIVRYARAMGEAFRYMQDPKNRDEITKMMLDITHETPAVVSEIAANYANPKLRILPKQGELDVASFKHLLDIIKESGVYSGPIPPAERFIDVSYARAAGLQ